MKILKTQSPILQDQLFSSRHKPTFGAKRNLAGADIYSIFRKHLRSNAPASLEIPREEYVGYRKILMEMEFFLSIQTTNPKQFDVKKLMKEMTSHEQGLPPSDMERSMKEIAECANQYANLVDKIADILQEQGITPNEEEKFITSIREIMDSNLKIRYGNYGNGFLCESMTTNEFNCANSSFLVFDVGKKLGIAGISVLSVPNHALIATENFLFETTSPMRYTSIKYLPKVYPRTYARISDPKKLDILTYANRGAAYFYHGKYELAIKDYKMAMKLNPDLRGWLTLGFAYCSFTIKKITECFARK